MPLCGAALLDVVRTTPRVGRNNFYIAIRRKPNCRAFQVPFDVASQHCLRGLRQRFKHVKLGR